MRLCHLTGKEVINFADGARLGMINECELTFDGKTGQIQAIILPSHNTLFNFLSEHRTVTIPWKAVRKIGDEIIIVDVSNS